MGCDNRKNTSPIWEFFIKKDGYLATCKGCYKDFSYKGTVSNLRKHWMNKHKEIKIIGEKTDSSDSEQEISTDNPNPTWKFYDVLDSDKFVANCKICDQEVPYDSVSDLTRHIKHHNVATNESDEEDVEVRSGMNKAPVWQFFKCIDNRAKVAKCLICERIVSFPSSDANLIRHIKNKHPQLEFEVGDNEEENTNNVDMNNQKQRNRATNDEKDPIEMDTIYLDDWESLSNRTPQKKNQHSNGSARINRPSFKRQKILKEQILNNRSRSNRFSNIRSSISSDEEVRSRNIKNEDSLNYFGRYVISLLKDLPKHVSEQLQGEIIKQILTTKLALQTTAEFSGTNSELVTVTISNTDTELNVVNTDVNKTETNAE